MELREAQASEIEMETVLDFEEMVLANAWNLWKAAPSEQKPRLQQVLFPHGVKSDASLSVPTEMPATAAIFLRTSNLSSFHQF